MRKVLSILLSIALLLIITMFLAWRWYQGELNKPLNISNPYKLTLTSGQGLSNVARQLQQDGLLERTEVLKLLAREKGTASQIKAGQYELEVGTTPKQLFDILVEGKVVLEQVTIPEGYTFKEMLDVLHKNDNINATLKDKTSAAIMDLLGKDGEHPEGRFLPETYRFAKGTDDLTILSQAYTAMQEVLNDAWEQKSPDSLLKTPYEALTLASIIEKETGIFSEQPTIAGVFNARLKKGMRLQTDPTVIYGMGDAYNGNIRKKDLRTDTPYNTYTRSGLTPTPIALPGRNAILAAVNPEQHNKLYFVATGDGDGRHYFSENLAEHNKAVQRYLKKYRENNR